MGWSVEREKIRRIIDAKWFQYGVVALITINAAILGLETYGDSMKAAGLNLQLVNTIIIVIFIVELALRIYVDGLRFFRNGWNIFDFVVIIAAVLPAGGASSALRLFRLLRVFRLLSAVKMMRLVIGALGASMPGVFIIGALFFMVLYVFAIASTTLFGALDPADFGNLGLTFVSLYRLVMGDGWPDIVAPLASHNGWIWAYFILFSLIGSVVLLNLFVAVVVEAMDRVKSSEEDGDPAGASADLAGEIRKLREDIAQLKVSLEQMSESVVTERVHVGLDSGAPTLESGGPASEPSGVGNSPTSVVRMPREGAVPAPVDSLPPVDA